MFGDADPGLAALTDFMNFGGETANGDFLSGDSGNYILIGSAQSDALMGGDCLACSAQKISGLLYRFLILG